MLSAITYNGVRIPVEGPIRRQTYHGDEPQIVQGPGGKWNRPKKQSYKIDTNLAEGGFNWQSGEYPEHATRIRTSQLVSHIPGVLCPPLLVQSQNFATDISTLKAGNGRAFLRDQLQRHYLGLSSLLYRTVSATDHSLQDSTYAPASRITCLDHITTTGGRELCVGMRSTTAVILTTPTATPPAATTMDWPYNPTWGIVEVPAISANVIYANDALYIYPFSATRSQAIDEDRSGVPGEILETAPNRILRTEAKDTVVPLSADWGSWSITAPNGGFAVGLGPDGNTWWVMPVAGDPDAITVPRKLRKLTSLTRRFSSSAWFATGSLETVELGFSVNHAAVWDMAGIVAAGAKRMVLVATNGQVVDLLVFGQQGPTATYTIAGIYANWPDLVAVIENTATTLCQLWRYQGGRWTALSEQITTAGAVIPPTGPIDLEQRRLYVVTPNTTSTDVDRIKVLESGLNPLEEEANANFATGSKTIVLANLHLPDGEPATLREAYVGGSPDWPITANSTVQIETSDDGGSTWDDVGTATAPRTWLTPATPIELSRQVMVRITIAHTSGAPASALPIDLVFLSRIRNRWIFTIKLNATEINTAVGPGDWDNIKTALTTGKQATPTPTLLIGTETHRADLADEDIREELADVGGLPKLVSAQLMLITI